MRPSLFDPFHSLFLNTPLKVATFKCNSSSTGTIPLSLMFPLHMGSRVIVFRLALSPYFSRLLPPNLSAFTGIRNFCESCHKHGFPPTFCTPMFDDDSSYFVAGWNAVVIPEHRAGCNKMHPPNGSVPIFRYFHSGETLCQYNVFASIQSRMRSLPIQGPISCARRQSS